MLSLVNDLAESRIWLREECAYLFYRILPDLCERKQNLAQLLVNQVLGAKTGLAETPEGIAIWLKAQQQTPPLKLPKGVWHHHNVLNPKESTRLARTMADAAKEAEETHTSGSRAVWRPRLHFAWEVILSHLLSPLSQPNKRCISFGDFWKTVVDRKWHFYNCDKAHCDRNSFRLLLVTRTQISRLSGIPDYLKHDFRSNGHQYLH